MEVSSGKRHRSIDWWFEDDGLFNLDEEAHAEKQQCAVAASNVIRNFSFMPDNETIMAQHRHCMETMFQCIEDQNTGTELCHTLYFCCLLTLYFNNISPFTLLKGHILAVLIYGLKFVDFAIDTSLFSLCMS